MTIMGYCDVIMAYCDVIKGYCDVIMGYCVAEEVFLLTPHGLVSVLCSETWGNYVNYCVQKHGGIVLF
jgi:hypothetical protein